MCISKIDFLDNGFSKCYNITGIRLFDFGGIKMKINIWKIAILLVSLLGLTGCAAALETYSHLYPHKNEEVSDKLNKLCG